MVILKDRIYKNAIETIGAFSSAEMPGAIARVEELAKKYTLIRYIRYEAKDFFLGGECNSELPLLWFEAYETSAPRKSTDAHRPPNIRIESKTTYEEYASAISEIKQKLSAGLTYQVNYTYCQKVFADVEPVRLFEHLVRLQQTPYAAFIENEHESVISLSPELFFRVKDGELTTEPMKGTAGRSARDGAKRPETTPDDEKNKAENLMIVDLLRNDMSPISIHGTVRVEKLFEVKEYPTLYQMVSRIKSKLSGEVGLGDILKSLFPCGSVTGAPKISTMRIIRELEKSERGIYCGAIGFLNPREWTFSVAIRTLQKARREEHYNYGVGGAITWDSKPWEEWIETKIKSRLLCEPVKLVETIGLRNSRPVFAREHCIRMQDAAQSLGYAFDPSEFMALANASSGCGRLRILLDKEGNLQAETIGAKGAKNNIVEVSPIILDHSQEYLRYKTTWRPWYDEAMRRIRAGEIFDEIFFNDLGQLCEGARTNIVLKIGGRLYTPPQGCGLLGGIMRAKLLERGACAEKILYADDLAAAEKIYCLNSVRGMKEVRLRGPAIPH